MTINKIRPRHPEKVNKPKNPIKKKPHWISQTLKCKEFFLQDESIKTI